MTFDLIATIMLTASAAIVIATLAIGFGVTIRARIVIAVALSAWFVLIVGFASTEIFHYQRGIFGAPGLGLSVLLPIVILCFTVLRSASLRHALENIPVSWLIGVNSVRVIGVDFVILYALHRLPAPFAPLAGWGDIFIGVTALPVAWLAANGTARPLVALWNSIGVADLVIAVGLGTISSPGPIQLIVGTPDSSIMAMLPWLLIPGFFVPLLMTTHLAVFYRLGSWHGASDMRADRDGARGLATSR